MTVGKPSRSFGLVDHKVAEADFFLRRVSESGFDFFAVRCYVSAFIGSMRSVTYTIQTVLGNQPEFPQWYEKHQAELRSCHTCRFFHQFRNINHHVGDNLVSGGGSGPGKRIRYWFQPTKDIKNVPSEDVETACLEYTGKIVSVVFDCYCKFGPLIDAHQRYTAEYFSSIGRTIEDAEEELGFPRGWTDVGNPGAEAYRWQALRDTVTGCEINHLFNKYLGKQTPVRQRLPEYAVHSGEVWHKLKNGGQVYIPEAYRKTGCPEKDMKMYLAKLKEDRQSQ
jgi:hypothetical protein